MKRRKAWLAGFLALGSVSLAVVPTVAQVYPTCPPGYFFAPAYALCFPAGYGYDPGYFEGQGFYPYAPGFVLRRLASSAVASVVSTTSRATDFMGHGGGHLDGFARR